LERVSTLRYSVVPRIFERGYPVVEVTRGKRSGVVANVSAIGCIGVVIVATRGEAGPGEVLVKIRGGSEAFIAWSPEPLPKGTTVLVIDERGSRAVDVSAWTDPLRPDSPNP